MEAEWQAHRALLRDLIHTGPDLTLKELAASIGRSYSWAKNWTRRLAAAPPEDLDVLRSRSLARKTPPPDWDPLVWRRVEHRKIVVLARPHYVAFKVKPFKMLMVPLEAA